MKLDILFVLVVFSLFCLVQSPPPNGKRDPNTKPGRSNKGPPTKLPKNFKKYKGMKEKYWKQVVKIIKKIKHLAAKQKHREQELPTVLEDSILLADVALTPLQAENYLAGMTKKPKKSRRRKRKVISFSPGGTKKWTLPIPYKIQPDFTTTQQNRIHQAIYHLHVKTCLRFEFYEAFEDLGTRKHILFIKSTDCWSYLGEISNVYRQGPQPISLSDKCANWIGDIIHELGHAAGLIHEHQRPDRDNFLWIHTANIKPADLAQFTPWDSKDVLLVNEIKFDYKSVMEYDSIAYSNNFQETILPHDALMKQEMGQPTRASFRDIQALNYIYCSKCSATYPTCERGGYLKPPSCSYCNCPPGFIGNTCQQLDPGYGGCSPSNSGIIPVNDRVNWNCLQSPNYGTGRPYPYRTQCNWELKAPSHTDTIEARFFGDFGIPCRNYWLRNFEGAVCVHWVEIRTHKPIQNRGSRFCCSQRPTHTLESTGEMMVLFDTNFDTIPQGAIPNLSSMYMKGFKLCYKLVGPPSDPCAASPCRNGGSCFAYGEQFFCRCTSEYTGTYCEQKILCQPNPCMNGGTCHPQPDTYVCACPQRYYGINCQYIFW